MELGFCPELGPHSGLAAWPPSGAELAELEQLEHRPDPVVVVVAAAAGQATAAAVGATPHLAAFAGQKMRPAGAAAGDSVIAAAAGTHTFRSVAATSHTWLDCSRSQTLGAVLIAPELAPQTVLLPGPAPGAVPEPGHSPPAAAAAGGRLCD